MESICELSKTHKLGLVTGNIEFIARAKIGLFNLAGNNLNDYFNFGGFGDESYERKDLIKIASSKAYNFGFDKDEVYVIGDMVRDIEAGKLSNSRTIAVSTGIDSLGNLRNANPDYLINNLLELIKIF